LLFLHRKKTKKKKPRKPYIHCREEKEVGVFGEEREVFWGMNGKARGQIHSDGREPMKNLPHVGKAVVF